MRFRENPSRIQVIAANPMPSSSQFHRKPWGILWIDRMLSEKNRKAIRTTAEIEIVIIPKRFLRIDSFILEAIEIFSCSFFKYRRGKPIICHRTAIVREFHKPHCIIKFRNLQQQFVNFPATTANADSISFFYENWMEFAESRKTNEINNRIQLYLAKLSACA